jgi:16S rRNA processing protein RimM
MAPGDPPLPASNPAARVNPLWAWLARIRRPQGRKGEVFADLLTDFPEKFAERPQLWLLPADARNHPERSAMPAAARPVSLVHHWLHKGGVVLHFAGIDSISAAEELTGLIVAVPRAERVPLAEDEAYISDLVGCLLVDVAGEAPVPVGEIEEVDRSAGPVPLFVVRGTQSKGDGEILIPFAKSFLRRIDLDARRVEMALPPGLVNLDEAEEA